MKVVLTAQAWAAEYSFEKHYALDTSHVDAYVDEAGRPAEGRRLMRQREGIALGDIQTWAEEMGEPVARMELSWTVVPDDSPVALSFPPDGTPAIVSHEETDARPSGLDVEGKADEEA